MSSSRTMIWPIVHAERARLVDDLSGLPTDAWATASLCPGWDVHDVLAHLVDSATTTRIGFVRRMISARFDFDADNELGIRRHRHADPAGTLDAMRAVVTATSTPPAAPATRLVEAFVHGEDIRRPLGITGGYPPAPVVEALRHQVATSVSMGGGKQRVRGMRLVVTETGETIGDDAAGAEVRGRAIDLLLAVSGRAVSADAFDGPGAARLCVEHCRRPPAA
ncbi:maleylpyruvate isomerase family mycothiol-dependent enzyme [Gordonia sp. OPL2]|uniref:maleylpyruvate isomerase family mycothiol-dependent enzyme n=1 Tax=Gordonia sp. OPL2 TaxID=2486274 RepID=UPI0016565FC6|nr:maleylpyruvate isomerase family mycothiol-dependent enzyme [Gordonia sp. OPL2]ROZ82915.1 maleylpyruvate isomerase family mycothiol-dependent enzyme [Gordonia sp. OPL2]